MPLLEVNNLKKVYNVKKFKHKYSLAAVDGVSLEIEKGKCLGLVGESGCGKSTIAKLILGLEKPTEGQINFNGLDLTQKNKGKMWRKDLQMVFQDSFDAVNHRLNAKQIIENPIKNFYKLPQEEVDKKIDELLEKVGISVNEKEKYPQQFSGGQLQRICIARALASDPKLIVLDEPLSSLDVSVQAQILNLLQDLKNELEISYLLISHDLEAVYYLSDSIYVMYGGRIMESIEDINLFDNMKHPYTKKLLSSSPEYRMKNTVEDIEEISDDSIDASNLGCPYANRCPQATDKCFKERPITKEIEKNHLISCHLF